MAGTTPEIKTKFTLDGIDKAAGKFRQFQKIAADAFGKTRSVGGKTFEPLSKSLVAVESKAKQVAKTLATVGLKHGFTGLKVGAVGAGTAVGGLAAKFSLVSKAATAASKETAAALQKIGQDSRRLGAAPGDLAVLGFAAKKNGIDPDEIGVNLAHIGGLFKQVQDQIKSTRSEYQSWNTLASESLKLQLRNPAFRNENNKGLYDDYMSNLANAAASSLDYLEDALQKNAARHNTIRANDKRDADDIVAEELDYKASQQGLVQQRKAVIDSFGPEGQGLFALRGYGLDLAKAMKGGTEGLIELSEAIKRVGDENERVRISMLLFGEDAGPKMLPLMMQGRKGIEDYRKELERLGGAMSKADVDQAEKYQNSAQNLQTAIEGVRLEISRNLWPYMQKTNEEMTEWLVKSRKVIAKEATEAFLATKGFATDVVHLMQGNDGIIQTKWLDVVVKKTQLARAAVGELWKQISLVWSGKDSDWPWLNAVVDGLGTVKRFAVEVFGLFQGKSAKEFGWLNDVKENVLWFGDRVSEAFDMFKGTLKIIKDDFIKPIADWMGQDVTSTLLYVGMLRFTGVLGLVAKGFGLLKGGLGTIIGMGAGLIALVTGVGKVAGFVGKTLGVGGTAAGVAGAASTAVGTAEAAASAAAVAASMAGVSRSAAAASTQVASVGKAAADVARGSRLPELIGDIANIAGGAAAVSGKALPGVCAAAGKAGEAMGAMSKTATTGLGSILQRLPVVGGAFGSFGSKVAALFDGLTGKIGTYVTALGGIQPALAKLGMQFGILAGVAAGAFAAGQFAMGKWQEMLGTQDSYDGIHKSQADLMRIQGDAYLNKRLSSREENDILTKRAFYNRQGGNGTYGATAAERFEQEMNGLSERVLGQKVYTGPMAEYDYRTSQGWTLDPESGMYIKEGEAPQRQYTPLPGWDKQASTPPPVEKRIQLDFNVNDKRYSGVFEESAGNGLADQIGELMRKL